MACDLALRPREPPNITGWSGPFHSCQIPAKKRPKRSVGLDAVVEPIDEHPDRGRATDARQEIAASERTTSFRVSQEPSMFHLVHQGGQRRVVQASTIAGDCAESMAANRIR